MCLYAFTILILTSETVQSQEGQGCTDLYFRVADMMHFDNQFWLDSNVVVYYIKLRVYIEETPYGEWNHI